MGTSIANSYPRSCGWYQSQDTSSYGLGRVGASPSGLAPSPEGRCSVSNSSMLVSMWRRSWRNWMRRQSCGTPTPIALNVMARPTRTAATSGCAGSPGLRWRPMRISTRLASASSGRRGTRLPSLHNVVWALMSTLKATELGGCLLTRLPPGGRILPHQDDSWHAWHFNRKVYGVLRSNPWCINRCEDEAVSFRAGELWSFVNTVPHSVENGGETRAHRGDLQLSVRDMKRAPNQPETISVTYIRGHILSKSIVCPTPTRYYPNTATSIRASHSPAARSRSVVARGR